MNYKGLGVSKNTEKALSLFIDLIKEKYVSENDSPPNFIIACGGNKYNFTIPGIADETKVEQKERKSQYTKKIVSKSIK